MNIYYYDIETYSPTTYRDTRFHYGVISDSAGNKTRYDDWEEMFFALVAQEDDVKFIVAHNGLGYDMPNFASWVHESYGDTWRVNASKTDRNDYRIHRFGDMRWEIYEHSYSEDGQPLNPVVAVDSMKHLPGALASWASSVGLEKGETPIYHMWVEPTEQDWTYCETDVEILRRAFQGVKGEEALRAGLPTVSSTAQASIKVFAGNERKTTFSPARKVRNNHYLPPKITQAIQEDLNAYVRRCQADLRAKNQFYPPRLASYERSKARKAIETAHIEALSQRAQNMIAYRRAHPTKTYSEETQKRWQGIKPVKDCAHSIITQCVVPHKAGGYNEGYFHQGKYDFQGDLASMIRPALRGGIVRPFLYVNTAVADVISCDINSLYPAILLQEPIYGRYLGVYELVDKKEVPPFSEAVQWIARVRLKARCKPGHHATLKRQESLDRIYERELDWDGETSWFSSVDYTVLIQDYDIEELSFQEVYLFAPDEEMTRSVREHIHFWEAKKKQAEPGSAEYAHCKLMLNSIWGRWAMTEKFVVQEGEKVDIGDKKSPIQAAIFTTSFARARLASAIRIFAQNVLYVDTDSIHLFGVSEEEIRAKLNVHAKEFGAWKIEHQDDPIKRAKYVKPKTYIHEFYSGKVHLTTAGSTFLETPTVDEFGFGFSGLAKNSRENENGTVTVYTVEKTIAGQSAYEYMESV